MQHVRTKPQEDRIIEKYADAFHTGAQRDAVPSRKANNVMTHHFDLNPQFLEGLKALRPAGCTESFISEAIIPEPAQGEIL